MASERPPSLSGGSPSERAGRRPWYLVLALLICSGLGACGSTDGWGTIEIYRGAPLELARDIPREEDRKTMQAAVDSMLAAMDVERPRVFPLSAAEFVLGIAMFVFAAAAMMGRGGARRVLVQIVIAQAVLVFVTFVLTPKLRWANIDITLAQAKLKLIAHGDSPEVVAQQLPALRVLYQGISIAWLFVRSVIAALIVVALTRPRARAFYDAQSERPTEG